MATVSTTQTPEQSAFLKRSGIRRVSAYTAPGPVECCDRCSAGIRYVTVVEYADGFREKYGSECIKKILDGAPNLLKLFRQNEKLLKRYQDALEIFSRQPEEMPRGREYFNSGLYFVANSEGKDIMGGQRGGHWFFHPLYDQEKNGAGRNYVVKETPEEYRRKQLLEIEREKPWFEAEVKRIETFLARILITLQREQAKKGVA